MAGHSQFANIKHRKGAQDAKKSKVFSKLRREILVSARLGGPEPEFNSRLRYAIVSAKKENMPKDKIEAAIAEASSPSGGVDYEEVRYEGYAPHGIAVIITALTDNRSRTASEVRAVFTKNSCSLAESGGVSFMFNHVGVIRYSDSINYDKLFEVAIESGASDLIPEKEDDNLLVVCEITDFGFVRDKLIDIFGEPVDSSLSWRPLTFKTIDNSENLSVVLSFIENLEDLDDVQKVESDLIVSKD